MVEINTVIASIFQLLTKPPNYFLSSLNIAIQSKSMTAVLAIDFYHEILVVADCRVTWMSNSLQFQDNLQKVYPMGPTGIFGFAGGIAATKQISIDMMRNAKPLPIPNSASDIVEDISKWAKESYSSLSPIDKVETQLMYVAADYGNIQLVTPPISFSNHIMVKMVSPDFDPIQYDDYIALGYATKYPPELILEFRNSMLNYSIKPDSKSFQILVSVAHFGESLSRLAGDNSVGGLFSVGIVNLSGVQWFPYSYGERIELKIEDGGFVQYDHQTNVRVPLKTLLDFDARKPDSGISLFNMP